MCCFCLHFLILMCYVFQKIKNLLQFTFEKITFCAKREKKITCREEKSQPPLDIKWSVPYIPLGHTTNIKGFIIPDVHVYSHCWKASGRDQPEGILTGRLVAFK